jgi:hypothetical protein
MKLAFYAFINFRLIGIHAGIQGGHAAGELQTRDNQRRFSNHLKVMAEDWLNDHKVFVFLSGGQSCDIVAGYNEWSDRLKDIYPTVLFREEGGAFGDTPDALGCATAWGLVLPESVYAARWVQPTDSIPGHYRAQVEDIDGRITYHNWTDGNVQFDFLKYKNQFGLAK